MQEKVVNNELALFIRGSCYCNWELHREGAVEMIIKGMLILYFKDWHEHLQIYLKLANSENCDCK